MKINRTGMIIFSVLGLPVAVCGSEQREDRDGTTNAGTTEGTRSSTGGAADAMEGTPNAGSGTDTTTIRAWRDTIKQ